MWKAVFIALVAALLASIAIVRIYENDVGIRLISLLNRQFQGQITAKQFRLALPNTVVLQDAAILDAHDKPVFRAKKAEVSLSFLTFFHGDVGISKIVAYQPYLALAYVGDDLNIVQAFLPRKKSSSPSQTRVLLDDIELRDGEIRYDDVSGYRIVAEKAWGNGSLRIDEGGTHLHVSSLRAEINHIPVSISASAHFGQDVVATENAAICFNHGQCLYPSVTYQQKTQDLFVGVRLQNTDVKTLAGLFNVPMEVRGNLTGEASLHGRQIVANATLVNGKAYQVVLPTKSNLTLNMTLLPSQVLQINSGSLSGRDLSANVKGNIDFAHKTWAFEASTSTQLPSAKGTIQIRLAKQHSHQAAMGNMEIDELIFHGIQIGSVSAKIKLDDRALTFTNLSLRGALGRATSDRLSIDLNKSLPEGHVVFHSVDLGNGTASFKGTHAVLHLEDVDLEHLTAKVPFLIPQKGKISGTVEADGPLWFSHLRADFHTTGWREGGDATLTITVNNNRVLGSVLSKQVETHFTGTLNSLANFDIEAKTKVNVAHVEKFFKPLRDELVFCSLDGSFSTKWKKRPNTDAQIVGNAQVDDFTLHLPGVPTTSIKEPIRFTFSEQEIRFLRPAQLTFEGGQQLVVVGFVNKKNVDLQIDGRIPLLFAKLATTLVSAAEGAVDGTLSVTGSTKAPTMSGSLTPEKGSSITPNKLVDEIVFESGNVVLSPDKGNPGQYFFQARNLQMAVGEGKASLDGYVRLTSEGFKTKKASDLSLRFVGQDLVLHRQEAWIEGDFDLNLQTIAKKNVLSGFVNITDGYYLHHFSLNNFILSSAENTKTSAIRLGPLASEVELRLGTQVRSFRVEADTPAFVLDSYVTADVQLVGTLSSPRLMGGVQLVEGSVSFPSTKFQITPVAIPLRDTPGKFADPLIDIIATADLLKDRFGLKTDTTVEFTLKGTLDHLHIDLVARSGDLNLDRLRLLVYLLGPASMGQFEASEALRNLLKSRAGIRLNFGSTGKGVSTQVHVSVGSRFELEGTAAASAAGLNMQDLRLQLLLFDHLPDNQTLFFEGLLAPPVEGKVSDSRANMRLKYRVLEK